MTCVLVIDDHPVTHLGCDPILKDAGYETVIEAASCDEGYLLCTKHQPELIVLDLEISGMSGLAMIDRLLRKRKGVKILVFSMHDDPIFAACAISSGAHGYLTKNSTPEDFVEAIETIRAGKTYIEHAVATELAVLRSRSSENPMIDLSSREMQVLQLIGKGNSHSEIAEQLNLGYKTIINTCSALKQKLGAETLLDLVRIALQQTKGRKS